MLQPQKKQSWSFPALSQTAWISPWGYVQPYSRNTLESASSAPKQRGGKLGSQSYHTLELSTPSLIPKRHLWNGNKSLPHYYISIMIVRKSLSFNAWIRMEINTENSWCDIDHISPEMEQTNCQQLSQWPENNPERAAVCQQSRSQTRGTQAWSGTKHCSF